MLKYMDDRRKKAQNVMDVYLEALSDPEKIKSASLSQIATAFGIIIDKFVKNTNATSNLDKLDEILSSIGTMADIAINPVPNRDITDYEE